MISAGLLDEPWLLGLEDAKEEAKLATALQYTAALSKLLHG